MRVKKYIFYFFLFFILFSGLLNLNYYLKFAKPQYGFEKSKIKGIKGVVIQDSTPAKFYQSYVLIKLDSCINTNGDVATAVGIIRCQYKGISLYSGDKVTFYGKESDYGYNVKKLDYIRPGYNNIRSFILEELSNTLGFSVEANLVRMLLLGFSLEGESDIKNKARESGTSHVLALSGMHLVFFSYVFSLLLYPILKKDSKLLSLIFLYLYVVVIGPKPSLIRALIFRTLVFCFYRKNSLLLLFYTFLIQVSLFPLTIGELSTIYSYCAILGILLFAPVFDYLTPRFKPLVSYFSVSYSALIFTSPVSLKYFGEFYLGGLIISGVLSPLLFLLMGFGAIALFFKKAMICVNWLYYYFNKVLLFGTGFGKISSVKGYILFITPLLCILLLFCILKARRFKRYVEP